MIWQALDVIVNIRSIWESLCQKTDPFSSPGKDKERIEDLNGRTDRGRANNFKRLVDLMDLTDRLSGGGREKIHAKAKRVL